MKVELGRIVGLCLAVCLPPVLSSSCASSEEDPVFAGSKDGGGFDSSAGSGFAGSGTGGDPGNGGVGGVGGVNGVGGVGGVNPGGVGGTDPGGTGGTDPGGTGGASGSTSGTGPGGNSGTSNRMCNVAFCPNTGVGTVCCIDPPVDACGMDNGMGCMKTD